MNATWNTTDELVGQRVEIYFADGETEEATVIEVHTQNANIKVRADDGEILIGNQFETI